MMLRCGMGGRTASGRGRDHILTSTIVHESGATQPRVVLLQGPTGPFFGRLQDALVAAGWSAVKINFNAGDRLFHGNGRDISFSGSLEDWPQWLEGFLRNFPADAVLMFGDQRPIHIAARKVAQAMGVRAICFEEGYLRPDYVTVEIDGNNAASPLRRWRPPAAPRPTPPKPVPMPHNAFPNMARHAAQYYVAMEADFLRFPEYRHHRQRGIIRESLLWIRNWVRKARWRSFNLQAIHNIIEKHDSGYFVVALQVHDDLQLRRHGCGWTPEKLIEGAIGSFARLAHPQHHLVVKAHPLDRGHSAGREFTSKIAALHQVGDRVHYVDDGSVGLLARHSRGMITVNSTSAMASFAHGKPVLALGESFYEHLTANGQDRTNAALDRFWRLAPMVDMRRWEAFSNHMIETSLVNGNFYIEEQIGPTCERVMARLRAQIAAPAEAADRPAVAAAPLATARRSGEA